MEEQKIKLKGILKTQACLQIPAYQRKYEWGSETLEQAHKLASDLFHKTESRSGHWTGVLIMKSPSDKKCEFKQSGTEEAGTHTCSEVIDGQQRLTTIMLLIQAIEDHHLYAEGEELPKVDATKLDVQLQKSNRIELAGILENRLPSLGSENALRTKGRFLELVYTYFRWMLYLGENSFDPDLDIAIPGTRVNETDPIMDKWAKLYETENHASTSEGRPMDYGWPKEIKPIDCKAFRERIREKTKFTQLLTEEENEDALEIFNVLNGQRQELSQFDYFRNYVFSLISSEMSREDAEATYDPSWEDGEAIIHVSKTAGQICREDQFLYDYILDIGFNGKNPKIAKSFWSIRGLDRFKTAPDAQRWIKKEFKRAAERWRFARNPKEENVNIHANAPEFKVSQANRRLMVRLISMSTSVVPLLTRLLRSCTARENEKLSEGELTKCLECLECLLATKILTGKISNLRALVINNTNKINTFKNDSTGRVSQKFCELFYSLRDDWSAIEKLLLEDYREGTKDNPKGFYENRKPKEMFAIFECIELGLDQTWAGTYLDDQYSIEHVLPISFPQHWKNDFKSWGNARKSNAQERVHNIGNLWPVPKSVNSRLGNKKLLDKQSILQAEGVSSPSSNNARTSTQWTHADIDANANRLVNALKSRWAY